MWARSSKGYVAPLRQWSGVGGAPGTELIHPSSIYAPDDRIGYQLYFADSWLGVPIFFESADCTGQKYVTNRQINAMTSVPNVPISSFFDMGMIFSESGPAQTTLYYNNPVSASRHIQSQRTTCEGPCTVIDVKVTV